MSHVASCGFEFSDLDALAKVCTNLGAEFRWNQPTHAWFGRFMNDWNSDRAAARQRDPATFGKCLHAIRAPGYRSGDYEIGVVQNTSGTYDLVYDEWGPGRRINETLGEGCAKFAQPYVAEVSAKTLEADGYIVQRETMSDGRVRIHARDGGGAITL